MAPPSDAAIAMPSSAPASAYLPSPVGLPALYVPVAMGPVCQIDAVTESVPEVSGTASSGQAPAAVPMPMEVCNTLPQATDARNVRVVARPPTPTVNSAPVLDPNMLQTMLGSLQHHMQAGFQAQMAAMQEQMAREMNAQAFLTRQAK